MTTHTGSKTFGIAGTPKGDVLLNQDLLRLIANFVGPLSDLTLGLTLPFKRLPWFFFEKSWLDVKWNAPDSKLPKHERGVPVNILPALKHSRYDTISWSLRTAISEDVSMGFGLSGKECQIHELWKVLGCPESFALGGNVSRSENDTFRFMRQRCNDYYPESTPLDDPVRFLWMAGEGLAAFWLMKGEADMKDAAKMLDLYTRDWYSVDLYIRGFVSHEETNLSPSQILRLCNNEKKRHFAIPFLKRGDFHDDQDMSDYLAKPYHPRHPYDFLLDGSDETFRFITKYATLDRERLRTSRFYGKCDFRGVVRDYMLFSDHHNEWKHRDIRKCLDTKDCSEDSRCEACWYWNELIAIYLYRNGAHPLERLPFPHSHLALRILLDAYLFRGGIRRRKFRNRLMLHLGTGFMDGVKGRTGLEGKIDHVLVALSQGKRDTFITRFLKLTDGLPGVKE